MMLIPRGKDGLNKEGECIFLKLMRYLKLLYIGKYRIIISVKMN